MKKALSIIILTLLIGFVITVEECAADKPPAGTNDIIITVTVTGEWNLIIDSGDLRAGAGSHLIRKYISAPNEVIIDISGAKSSWKIDVHKIDSFWHKDFKLFVRRTSNGIGHGRIWGGLGWRKVKNAKTSGFFFAGNGNRESIDIQFTLKGVSIKIPPRGYSTTVYYTITGR